MWKKKEIVTERGEQVMAQTPVIVSASRSTDIPAFYSDWFINRLEKGYVKWINPFNGVPLYVSLAEARLFVFWSKNPKPMLECLPGRNESPLDVLDARHTNYYFQFTLNDYDEERIEPRVPPVAERIETFRRLSERLGRDRVVWRFDPLVLTDKLDIRQLVEKVERLGDRIAPFTSRLVFSFIDVAAYRKVVANLSRCELNAREFRSDEMEAVASEIGRLVKDWGISAGTCAEIRDLAAYGIEHNRCVDDRLMVKCFSRDIELMKFIGARYVSGDMFADNEVKKVDHWEVSEKSKKDTGQRTACGCVMSKDIGMYNTCPHLCRYCYANTSDATVLANRAKHVRNPHGELLIPDDDEW